MKKIILILSLFLSGASFAQNMPSQQILAKCLVEDMADPISQNWATEFSWDQSHLTGDKRDVRSVSLRDGRLVELTAVGAQSTEFAITYRNVNRNVVLGFASGRGEIDISFDGMKYGTKVIISCGTLQESIKK